MKKWSGLLSILAALLLILGILIPVASADKATLEKVKQAIKEKNAKWDAGETSVSVLPDDQFRMMLGAIFPDEPPKGARNLDMGFTAADSLDWRSNGGNYVSSVKNQGSCGSCWAFGTTASLESLNMIVNGTPVIRSKGKVVETNLSEQELVSCLWEQPTSDRGKCYGCEGCDPYWAYDYLVGNGVPIESCFPYTASNSACEPLCPTGTVKIDGWSAIDPVSKDALESVVSQHPIPVGFQVYQDFQYYRSGVYSHVSGDRVGGHIVCLIGWNNNPPPEGKGKNKVTPPAYFICKNSWGTSWGESGFFRIAQSEIGTDVDFGARAADFNLGVLAPPRLAKPTAVVTFWGSIKSSY